ncbi:MAG: hypothetical protein RBR64_06315 [Bacteroidales bacterium]|jgi:hypothetical protein|nr:hypothetical protein [Bacteroidales bacterium]
MKNLLIPLLLLLFTCNNSLNAQSDFIWEPIGLTLTGNNVYQGVEAYYRLTECNGEYSIILKFVNTNNQKIRLEWEDAIFTNNQEWVTNINDSGVKSLIIYPNSEISCSCSQPIEELFVKIREFIPDVEDFFKYRTVSFKIDFIEE